MSRSSSSKKKTSSAGTFILLIVVILLGACYPLSRGNPPRVVIEPAIDTPQAGGDLPSSNWWEVYFVSPLQLSNNEELTFRSTIPADQFSGSIVERLIEYIANARTSIHIASYEFDLTDVADALIAAKQRGVDVRWITDDEAGIEADDKEGHGQFEMLRQAGIELKDDQRGGLMHDKFWIFDGETVWTGSTNITVSGMFEQDNNVIVIHSPDLAAIYERQWGDMWAGEFGARSPSTVDQQQLTLENDPIQVLFSPEDDVIQNIIPYVQGAQTSIYFMAFTYTQADLGAAMIDRFQAGVDVQGVFEVTGSESEFGQMTPLFCANIPVRQDGNPAFLHHKVIIIDEKIVITGSLNFTNNANESNNENVIIIQDPQIAQYYIKEFQRVWAAGHDPDPAKLKCP
jgi:phosphatidylserine/phosphatidylglycerophosphate/cardiolipin synthase-like enzyme